MTFNAIAHWPNHQRGHAFRFGLMARVQALGNGAASVLRVRDLSGPVLPLAQALLDLWSGWT